MSELGETYRAMREYSQQRRLDRHLAADDTGWSKHSEYHWYRMIGAEKLEYWPSTARCRFKGRNANINSKFVKSLLAKDGDNS